MCHEGTDNGIKDDPKTIGYETMILYSYHTIGAINQEGKIEITVHPRPPSDEDQGWTQKDAQDLFTMLQNYFPRPTVSLIRRAFLGEATNKELIQELERRLWT